MDEGAKRLWDVRLASIGPMLAICTLFAGLYQFHQGAKDRTRLEYELLEKREAVEFRRKLWLERLASYQSITKLAGRIAAHGRNDSAMSGMVKDFLEGYYGNMVMVEDKEVETKMVAFREALDLYTKGFGEFDRIKKQAIGLSEACRRSVEKGTRELELPAK